jgi:hypothetical protein
MRIFPLASSIFLGVASTYSTLADTGPCKPYPPLEVLVCCSGGSAARGVLVFLLN